MKETNCRLPVNVLKFFLIVLNEKSTCFGHNGRIEDSRKIDGNAFLSFDRLQQLIQIFYKCPASTKSNKNNSKNMRNVITMPGHEKDVDFNNIHVDTTKGFADGLQTIVNSSRTPSV